MFKLLIPLMLLDLPDIAYFQSNPFDAIAQVFTSPFGVFAYIFIMFAVITIVFVFTKEIYTVGVSVILWGILADFLYPAPIVVFINFAGVALIFGGVIWRKSFKES